MALFWDQWRREIAAGKEDWIGAAQGDYGEYFYRARKRFERGEAATVKQVKEVYHRAAESIRRDIANLTPGTLRHSHLTSLAGALDRAIKQMNEETLAAIQSGIRLAVDEATSGAEQVTMDLIGDMFERPAIKWMFADINQRAVLSLLARTRHDGLKLSDRVWRIGQGTRRAITMLVEDGIARGLDARTLARELERYLQPDKWTAFKAETRRRLGVPKNVSMEAMRLAVTEMQHAFHEGTINSYRAIPSAKGIYWRLSHSHPIPDVCDDYASHNGNGFWPKGQEPAKPHPWCRCVAVPAMEDPEEFTQRLREWMQNPSSHPDIEEWYNNTARRFLKRPTKFWTLEGKAIHKIAIRHGWSQQLANTIEAIGEELGERTIQSNVEFASTIDVQTSKPIGEILGGERAAVNMKPHLDLMKENGEYIIIHTHPASSSFSSADVAFVPSYANIKSMVVYGKDGTKYAVSRKPGSQVASVDEIIRAFEEEKERLFEKYKQKVLSGEMDSEEAWKEHSHEIWTNIADKLGLIYDRKKGSGW